MAPMPVARVGDLDVAFEDLGSGDPVVFASATGAPGAVWMTQTSVLSEEYRCLPVDLRDSGNSSYVEAPYVPADLAADLAGLIESLGIAPAHVAGYSLGGAAAQELAIARPELVRSLVLVSTWGRSDDMFAATMRNWQAIRRGCGDDLEAFYRALMPWAYSAASFALPGFIDGLVTMAMAFDPPQRVDGFLRQCDADVAHDAADRLSGVRSPALVIVGEEDVTTPPRHSRQLCDLLREAELVLVPGAGHGALHERPDVVTEAIRSFLEKH